MSNKRKPQTKIQMKEIAKFIKEGLKITAKTKINKYNYHPKTEKELHYLLKELIEERGNEDDFNDIDTSEITDMSNLFDGIDKFNGDISNWDVSNVTDMSFMFCGCRSFNQDISNWDVSKVTNMKYMFYRCESFNQLLAKWNVYHVINMDCMFCWCKSFNQDISKWNVSNVKYNSNILYKCPIEEKHKPNFK